ncbi:MAG TPA: hypothetical protein VKR06_18830 [Ktedonosporobacter sp.]|nr:hypothetical protein [Ktedonosporobacter sp.]
MSITRQMYLFLLLLALIIGTILILSFALLTHQNLGQALHFIPQIINGSH